MYTAIVFKENKLSERFKRRGENANFLISQKLSFSNLESRKNGCAVLENFKGEN